MVCFAWVFPLQKLEQYITTVGGFELATIRLERVPVYPKLSPVGT